MCYFQLLVLCYANDNFWFNAEANRYNISDGLSATAVKSRQPEQRLIFLGARSTLEVENFEIAVLPVALQKSKQ